MQKKLTLITRFRIDGKYYTMDELPPQLTLEEANRIIEERIDLGMRGIGYERVKPAETAST